MAEKKFRLKIVTPGKMAVDKDVTMVIMQTIDGQIGVLAGHEPVVTVLDHGVLRYYEDEKIETMAVFGGYAEINQREVVVLAETAELPEDIDIERARQAKERANRHIEEKRAETDVMRAKVALRKSLVRLELSGQPLTTDKK
ncbi:MAG: F0F1 ATP synthase subunit epsilon [Defluviitaleaceae bacterium]|nr:F0F1 ATP synthase subunit epsilon [Defluviitaleaceae bacterium]